MRTWVWLGLLLVSVGCAGARSADVRGLREEAQAKPDASEEPVEVVVPEVATVADAGADADSSQPSEAEVRAVLEALADDGKVSALSDANDREVPRLDEPVREGSRDLVQIGGGASSLSSQQRAVLLHLRAGLRSCWKRELVRATGLTNASARLTIRMGPDGAVVAAVIDFQHGGSAELRQCLIARVRRAQFAPPPGAAETIQVPLTFYVTPPPTP